MLSFPFARPFLARAQLIGLLAGAALLSAVGPASAGERTMFEKVKGWEIERESGDTSANPCLMSRSYKDKDDDDAENAVVFALNGSDVVLVLGYENWTWDKGEKVKVPFALGKKVINAKSSWVGEDNILKATFPDSLVPDLLAAKTIVLRFPDGEADFDIAGFPQAYESLRRCDSAPAKAPVAKAPVAERPVAEAPPAPAPAPAPKVAAPAPVPPPQVSAPPAPTLAPAPPPATPPGPAPEPAKPPPSDAQLKVYFVGLMFQRAIRECDVATTAKQRSAVEAKVPGLQPQDASIGEALRAEVAKINPICPSAEKEERFQRGLRNFVEKTPEEFVAIVEKEEAEQEAAQAATGAKPQQPAASP